MRQEVAEDVGHELDGQRADDVAAEVSLLELGQQLPPLGRGEVLDDAM